MPNFPRTGDEFQVNKGVANGYAGLGANALVPTSQLGTGAPDGNYLKGDQTWSTPPGASEVAMSNRQPAGTIIVPANYLVSVEGEYEIASGQELDLQNNSEFAIN